MSRFRWSYGVTTVPARRDTLLRKSLECLAAAGFPEPRLFVDGGTNDLTYLLHPGGLTFRRPALRTYGNWVLGLWELYLREPNATHYAMFQDDIIVCRNLRPYLEQRPWPWKGYGNLYSSPENESLFGAEKGWISARELRSGPAGYQTGRGALALVFTREGVVDLLSSRCMVERVGDPHRGWRSVDGAVVHALNQLGYREMVHAPGMVQHAGEVSTMGNKLRPVSGTFPGEEFDALSLLENKV